MVFRYFDRVEDTGNIFLEYVLYSFYVSALVQTPRKGG